MVLPHKRGMPDFAFRPASAEPGLAPSETTRAEVPGTAEEVRPSRPEGTSVHGLAALYEQHREAGEEDGQQDPSEPALLFQPGDAVKERRQILAAARAAVLIRWDQTFAMRAFDLRGHDKR